MLLGQGSVFLVVKRIGVPVLSCEGTGLAFAVLPFVFVACEFIGGPVLCKLYTELGPFICIDCYLLPGAMVIWEFLL